MKNIHVTLILCLSIFFEGFSQNKVDIFIDSLTKYYYEHPQEKIFLHTNQESYIAGDTVWFKLYNTVGVENKLSAFSGVGYVELINKNKEIVDLRTIKIINGLGIGNILLNDSICDGDYVIRAYTNWMKNSSQNYYFKKPIYIYSYIKNNIIIDKKLSVDRKQIEFTIRNDSVNSQSNTVSYSIGNETKVKEKLNKGSFTVPLSQFESKEKSIEIVLQVEEGKLIKENISLENEFPSYQVDLLFEAGTGLMGFKNTIAAKSINEKGFGVYTQIQILENDSLLLEFDTNKLGMGSSQIFLKPHHSYKAVAVLNGGEKVELDFPKIENSGIGLHVDNKEYDVAVELKVTEDLIDSSRMYILIHHLGLAYNISPFVRNKDILKFNIDKSPLPNGVLTISILDEDFQPILERPFFNYHSKNSVPLTVSLSQDSYSIRDHVYVELSSKDSIETSSKCYMSVTVVPVFEGSKSTEPEVNILSSLLLNNDIEGNIEKPSYYFEGDSVKNLEIDDLLLTQGWRKFKWNRSSEAIQDQYSLEKSITISGYTYHYDNKTHSPNIPVTLMNLENILEAKNTTSDKNGYFEFKNLFYRDDERLVLKASPKKTRETIIIKELLPKNSIDKSTIKVPNTTFDLFTNVDAAHRFFSDLAATIHFTKKSKGIQIDTVNVTKYKLRPDRQNSQNIHGAGKGDIVLTARDLEQSSPNLSDALTGRLAGVHFKVAKAGIDSTYVMLPYTTRGHRPMDIMIDGVWMTDPMDFHLLDTRNIQLVEVLKSPSYTSIYGHRGGNGIIIITSKSGADIAKSYNAKIRSKVNEVKRNGFSTIYEFYKPKYLTKIHPNTLDDVRTNLHWESLLETDKNGKASFTFYTSDRKGDFLINIQGIDHSGRIVNMNKVFTVH